mmetsp:Transcript_50333/g.98652  ORF Transcript_50333/g.98652 Transcript_50333/m.98652 type:complete len:107 (+) Transcript_50333:443-763(+)
MLDSSKQPPQQQQAQQQAEHLQVRRMGQKIQRTAQGIKAVILHEGFVEHFLRYLSRRVLEKGEKGSFADLPVKSAFFQKPVSLSGMGAFGGRFQFVVFFFWLGILI